MKVFGSYLSKEFFLSFCRYLELFDGIIVISRLKKSTNDHYGCYSQQNVLNCIPIKPQCLNNKESFEIHRLLTNFIRITQFKVDDGLY